MGWTVGTGQNDGILLSAKLDGTDTWPALLLKQYSLGFPMYQWTSVGNSGQVLFALYWMYGDHLKRASFHLQKNLQLRWRFWIENFARVLDCSVVFWNSWWVIQMTKILSCLVALVSTCCLLTCHSCVYQFLFPMLILCQHWLSWNWQSEKLIKWKGVV